MRHIAVVFLEKVLQAGQTLYQAAATTLPLDRISADDLMSLVAGSRTPPMVGAIVFLGGDVEPAQLLAAIRSRLTAVPRLRQRLVRLPLGWGRPLWVDDPSFSLADHVSVVECPVPGGRQA
ncbi:hypothetical protein FNU79_17325, partial [Deinococcus detaillensis]